MNLTTPRGKLHEAHQVVQVHWNETRDGWNDAAGRVFEADHWSPVLPTVEAALRAMDRLIVAMNQMRHECE